MGRIEAYRQPLFAKRRSKDDKHSTIVSRGGRCTESFRVLRCWLAPQPHASHHGDAGIGMPDLIRSTLCVSSCSAIGSVEYALCVPNPCLGRTSPLFRVGRSCSLCSDRATPKPYPPGRPRATVRLANTSLHTPRYVARNCIIRSDQIAWQAWTGMWRACELGRWTFSLVHC